MTVMPNIVINTSNISKGQSKAVTARITHWIMRFIGHLSKVAAGRTLQPATRDRCRCRVRLHRQWAGLRDGLWRRSEEHTSELQSLMRSSYAVFCLKKKRIKLFNIHNI